MIKSKIKILDCTLRDGGYNNEWNFGDSQNIIINNLCDSKVDIIELGFLKENLEYDKKKTLFDTVERISGKKPESKGDNIFVGMINYGEYSVDSIPKYKEGRINGIRVVFKKNDLEEALNFSKELKNKGYLVFIQPMVTIKYSDEELLNLIKKVNEFKPYALYLVDSFGVMKRSDLIRMSYLVDNNLEEEIGLGYHAHNNLQLAYSNAQAFLEINTKREKIVDSSVYGMGRGAGNLNTELFVEYLNKEFETNYKLEPLLEIIDESLSSIYKEKPWGYSLPYYLSAKHNCHPNYGTYLDNLNTLTVSSINEVLELIPETSKDIYDKKLIEELYLNYNTNNFDDKKEINNLKQELEDKEVLLLASGISLEKEEKRIKKYIKEKNPYIISINFKPKNIVVDNIFISNERRNKVIDKDNNNIIQTSNIKQTNKLAQVVNYKKLINKEVKLEIKDNSSLMLLKLLTILGKKEVAFAGLDGYSANDDENYSKDVIKILKEKNKINKFNLMMSEELKKLNNKIKIKLLTESKYKF